MQRVYTERLEKDKSSLRAIPKGEIEAIFKNIIQKFSIAEDIYSQIERLH